jgi:transcriptional regulator with XRE-family HTH domain
MYTNIYETIKDLAAAKKMSIAEVERKLDFSNGSLYKWTRTSPSGEKLKKVADFFDVSVDYLLGREETDLKDPIAYYRIDTSGLEKKDVDKIKNQLDDYTEFLKSKLRKKMSGD